MREYDDTELKACLSEVEHILTNTVYDDVIWGSDLNWDPARNTQFSRSMSAFVQEVGLTSL